jgi:multicomponent K+:H+ antiporter subunit E
VKRVLPHPIVSFFVALVWLGLHSSLAPLDLAGAALLAVLVPLALDRLLRDPVHVARPWIAVRLALVVLRDVVVANFAVARRVLGPMARLRPGFVEVPLDTSHPDAIALLAAIITIAPGSVSIDVDESHTRLLVHVLDLDDGPALVATIKRRYEAPLKEIFGC